MQTAEAQSSKAREAMSFLILSVFIWPVIAVGFVAAYGFAFWIFFILAGPPGPT